MLKSKRDACLHVAFWVLLTAFPVSLIGSGDVRSAQIVLHALLAAFLAVSLAIIAYDRPIHLPREIGWRLVTLILVAIAYFSLLSAANPMFGTTGDLLDVVRPIVYLVYFSFPLLLRLSPDQTRSVVKLLMAIAVVQVVFSFLVYVPAAWPLVDLYKGRTSGDVVLFHFFRWSGTSGYPSDFAFFLSFLFYLTFFCPPTALRLHQRFWMVPMFAVAILLTMSRGGIAAVAVMTGIGAVCFGKLRPAFMTLALILVAIQALFWVDMQLEEDLVHTGYVLELLTEGTEAQSAQHRVREMELAAEYATRYFPFGLGAARDEIYSRIRVVESLYGHYLIKWGVLGLALYFISVVYLSRVSWWLGFYARDPLIKAFGRAFFLLTLSVPLVFGLSSAISDRYKSLPFYYVLAGYAAMLYIQERRLAKSRSGHESADTGPLLTG